MWWPIGNVVASWRCNNSLEKLWLIGRAPDCCSMQCMHGLGLESGISVEKWWFIGSAPDCSGSGPAWVRIRHLSQWKKHSKDRQGHNAYFKRETSTLGSKSYKAIAKICFAPDFNTAPPTPPKSSH